MSSNTPKGLLEVDLNEAFFRKIINNISEDAEYIDHEEILFSDETGHISRMSKQSNDNNERVIGFRAFSLKYRIKGDQISEEKVMRIVLKVKIQGRQQWYALNDQMVTMGDDDIAMHFKDFFDSSVGSENRELACVSVKHLTLKAIQPLTLHTIKDIEWDIY